MNVPQAYSEELAQHYDRRHFGGRSGRYIFRRDCSALWALLDRSHCLALDIPCGSGAYTKAMAERGHRVVAADASSSMLALVRELGIAHSTVQCDIEQLPFPDDAFDATITLRLFSHYPKEAVVRMLKELRRVVRPGGRVIFDTFRWTPRRWPLLRRFLDESYIHVVAPTEVEAMILQAGLVKVDARSLYLFSPLWQRRLPFWCVRLLTFVELLLPQRWRLRSFWACAKEGPTVVDANRPALSGSC